ncbi:OmpA family protein, partial [Serratia marcescens]|uniref:OmpA family protein n=2 Tax=Enterobacterales TaxID=91347 RepID=UPI0013DCC728
PREHLEIQGHTDLQGNPAALQALSLRRAQALQQQLLARGIDAARLAVRGFGGDQPLLNTPSAAGQPTRARLTVVVRTP